MIRPPEHSSPDGSEPWWRVAAWIVAFPIWVAAVIVSGIWQATEKK